MDLPVLVLVYCTAAVLVLLFLLTALRGARRVDEEQDAALIDALRARRDELARRNQPLPPLRERGADEHPSIGVEQPQRQR